jgi:hypothetical protein
MKLQEAIKFKNKSRLLDKIEAAIVSSFRKIYKPDKKIGIDIFNTAMHVIENNPELISGDPESIGRTQLKQLLKHTVLKVMSFPFDTDDMKSVFKQVLIADVKKLKGKGYL